MESKLETRGWSTGRSNASLTSIWSSKALKLTGDSESTKTLGMGTLSETSVSWHQVTITRDCLRLTLTLRFRHWVEGLVLESKRHNRRVGMWDWASQVNRHFLGFPLVWSSTDILCSAFDTPVSRANGEIVLVTTWTLFVFSSAHGPAYSPNSASQSSYSYFTGPYIAVQLRTFLLFPSILWLYYFQFLFICYIY